MQGTILEATDVAKRFGATVAVDGVTFDVARHEIFALLGPNGAGLMYGKEPSWREVRRWALAK